MKLDEAEIGKNKHRIDSMIQHLVRGINTKNIINVLLADEDINKCTHLKSMLTSYNEIVINQIKNMNKQAEQLFFIDFDELLLKEEDEEWI